MTNNPTRDELVMGAILAAEKACDNDKTETWWESSIEAAVNYALQASIPPSQDGCREAFEAFDDIALSALRNHQTQIDNDGVMVGVSRQALDMAIEWIDKIEKQQAAWSASQPALSEGQAVEVMAREYWGKPFPNQKSYDELDDAFKSEMREGMRAVYHALLADQGGK